MYDVYLITNLVNYKKYIGFTSKGYKNRFAEHLKESDGNSKRYLCKAIRKYGKDNFDVQLIETVDSYEKAIEKEKQYIEVYNTFAHQKDNWGYNATLGGEGVNGLRVPKSMRDKLRKIKISQKAWVGENNPNYGKGHLMCGKKHFNFGKNHKKETIQKISKANKGNYEGVKNPATVKSVSYAKHIKTGIIYKADTFYELIKVIESLGVKCNRSSALAVIREKRKSHNGFIFFRSDITNKEIIKVLDNQYINNIKEPFKYEDHRKGKRHPNAKNVVCFAENIETNEIFKFDSWYELKQYISEVSSKNITYSNMAKVLVGKYKHVSGFRLYREDKTDEQTIKMISERYQSEPSTTSRKA